MRGAYYATRSTLGPRGRTAYAPVRMGALFSFESFYMHTVGDRAQAVDQMSLDATRLYQLIAHGVGILGPDGTEAGGAERVKKNPVWYQWWLSAAKPTFDAWVAFKREQTGGEGRDGVIGDYLSWTNRFKTDWSEYTAWAKRLDSVAKGAELLGIIPKDTPPVTPLPTTAIEDTMKWVEHRGEDAGNAIKKTLNLAEIAAYGVLGIGGALLVTSIVQNVRAGDDPIGKYVSYARRR